MRYLRATVTACVVAGLAACGGGGSDSETEIQIGIVAPITGRAANFGTEFAQSAELAVKEINEAGIEIDGQTYSIEAEVCDDQYDPSKSVICAQKIARDEPLLILANVSGAAQSIAPISEQSEFVLMAPSQTPDFTENGYPLVARSFANPAQTMPDLVGAFTDYLEENDIGTDVALMNGTDEFGTAWIDIFEEEWTENGGVVEEQAAVDLTATDFTNQIQSVLSADPDVIVLTSTCPTSGLIVKQARQLGYQGAFINSSACLGGEPLLEFAGTEVGTFISEANPANFPSTPSVESFQTAYRAEYGAPPTEPSAPLGYWSVHWFAEAVRTAGTTTDPAEVRAALAPALEKLKQYNLVNATGFDTETGDLEVQQVVAVTKPDGSVEKYTGS